MNEIDTRLVRNRRTTPSMVADALRDAIMQGVLKGGQRLRQDELAAQFGLSRIPIREAIRQLEGEGLLIVHPHRGAVVAALSGEELRELCDIRVALETRALRLAIPHMDDEIFGRAEAILVETDHESDVLTSWSRNNWRFHSTLYIPANRPRLVAMIKGLHDNIDRYLRLHVSMLNYKIMGQAEHWSILAACRRRDVAAAEALLTAHIEDVGTLLGNYLTDC